LYKKSNPQKRKRSEASQSASELLSPPTVIPLKT